MKRSYIFFLLLIAFFDAVQSQPVPSSRPVAVNLARGPYLNSALQNSIVIRWRTDIAADSKVSYGLSPAALTQSFTDNAITTEHIITLGGLIPNTLYYYAIGSSTQILQGDAANYFKTMPVAGSKQKMRFLAMGDMGTNAALQVNVRNAWLTFNGSNYTDGWLLLGDNAYNDGTDLEYQNNFFNIYQGSLTKNHVLWPSPGNHDYANNSARQADHIIPYYSIFTLPVNGEAGGLSSGNEAFYSYNYGNIHFVSLDSYGWESGNTRLYDTAGAQALWLKQDLAANTQDWTIVYFHHPPYTKGSHNSDTETELVNMREQLVPILERYKVDLVLNGHSHSYERSYLINGHYGLENTFAPATQALSLSGAKYDATANSCPYIKDSVGRNGIVYALVGSSGQVTTTTAGYPHNAMYYSNVTNGGALYFEVEDNRLDAKWVCADGVVRDQFTMMKNVSRHLDIAMDAGRDTVLTASWKGNYQWSTGATTRSITISPLSDTIISVTDGAGCITDRFTIELMQTTVSLCPPLASTSLSSVSGGSVYQWQVNSGNGFTNISDNANFTGSNAVTLQLANIPADWYGYQFRCLVDGIAGKPYQLRFLSEFTGSVSGVWENPANWSCNTIPDANTDVLISKGNVFVNTDAACRSLYVKPTAHVTVVPGSKLSIAH